MYSLLMNYMELTRRLQMNSERWEEKEKRKRREWIKVIVAVSEGGYKIPWIEGTGKIVPLQPKMVKAMLEWVSLLFSTHSFSLEGQDRMVNQCQRVLLPSLLHIIQWLHLNALRLHPMERLLLNFIPRWSEKRDSFLLIDFISVGCKEDVKVVRRYLKTLNKVWIKDNCGWEMIANEYSLCFLLWSHFLGTIESINQNMLSLFWVTIPV